MSQKKYMNAVYMDKFGQEPYINHNTIIPEPKRGEVLIKVQAAAIHPADHSFMKGKYITSRQPPCSLGIEGSGIVIKNGGGFLGYRLLNKFVAFTPVAKIGGSWAEYAIAKSSACIAYDPKKISPEQAALGFVNPITAIGLYKLAINNNSKAIVQTGAVSTVGTMLYKYCIKNGINVINVVRKQEIEKAKLELGNAKYIVASDDENFENTLQQYIKELQPTTLIDMVCGDLTAKILRNMPDYSSCYVYGMISLKPAQIEGIDLIFRKKSISGYNLRERFLLHDLNTKLEMIKMVQNDFESCFTSKIANVYTFDDAQKAIRYYKEHMTSGKVILKPTFNSKQQQPQPVAKL